MRKIDCDCGGISGAVFVFESIADYNRFCDPTDFKEQDRWFLDTPDDLSTWESVMKRVDRVWAEGLHEINEFVERLKTIEIPELKSRKRVPVYSDDDGDEVDLDRMRAGMPFFRKAERQQRDGALDVTVFTDLTAAGCRKGSDLLWRGAAAVALTHILESKGYRVELWLVDGVHTCSPWSGASKPKKNLVTGIQLKKTSDPIDQSTLCNVLSGWFFRTVVFTGHQAETRQTDTHIDRFSEGSVYEPRQKDLDHFSRDPNRVYSSGVFTRRGAEELIRSEVQRIAKQTSNQE